MQEEVYTWSQKNATKVIIAAALIVLGLAVVMHSDVSLSIKAPGIQLHLEAK